MIRSVMRNETPISPAVAGRLLRELREGGVRSVTTPTAEEARSVTPRELEILRLVDLAGGPLGDAAADPVAAEKFRHRAGLLPAGAEDAPQPGHRAVAGADARIAFH